MKKTLVIFAGIIGGLAACAGVEQVAISPTSEWRVPYPAGSADVHVVSVREGQLPGGAKHGFRQRPEGFVNVVVRRTAKPILLFLSSYGPVEWRISVEGGSLERVVAIGHYDQRITVSGARGVPTATHESSDLFAAAGFPPDFSFPHEAKGNKAVEVVEIMTALTGKVPASFQGDYGGTRLFQVDASSPAVELPQAKSAASSEAGKVVLEGPPWNEGQGIGEVTVKYGGSGPFTEAWASRGYSAGKAYFEATVGVVGGSVVNPHANVGVAEIDPRGEMEISLETPTSAFEHEDQNVYRHGDVFGIAIDYDAGVMYVRVNGQWITGQPGSGTGKRFRVGRERVAYVWATRGDNSRSEANHSLSWQVNFGASPFRDPLPQGFVSYDGSRR